MKRIRDERLIVRNLQNIRTGFFIENLAILIILCWQSIQQGRWTPAFSYQNPLFAVLMIGAFTILIPSVNVSSPIEDRSKVSWQRLTLHFLLEVLGAGLFFFWIISGNHPWVSLLAGLAVAAVPTGMELYANRFRQ